MASMNLQLAQMFDRLGEMNLLMGANRFKVIAYEKVARQLKELEADVGTMSRSELVALEGVGTGTADRILEFVEHGSMTEYDELAEQIPPGVLEVMHVPGVGPKSAATFWHEAGVVSLDTLAEKIDSGELQQLKGFGAKKIENIKKGMAFAKQASERKRIDVAYAVATRFVDLLRPLDGVARCEYAGSLRRGLETVGDVDVLVSLDKGACEGAGEAAREAVFDAFAGAEGVTEVLLRGDTKCSVRVEAGMQADLRIVAADQFGAAWMYFTGSKEHNIAMRERAINQQMRLSEYGLTRDGADAPFVSDTEEAVFDALGLAWVPPELREDRGELKLAEKKALPDLIGFDDVVAELHAHTTASDGVWSIEELAEAAAARGCHTVAVTDHSKGQVQANGLDARRLEKHIDDVHRVAEQMRGTIRILAGSEVDILTDGGLDYSDELLGRLDIVVASPHASLQQDPKTATKRLLRAIESGHVNVMGHPTGRLVMRREGLSPDIRALCRAAAACNVAMEINANAYRLDLRDSHVRIAIEEGCLLSINTDAHGPGNMDAVRYGVATARRGGARAADVINTWPRAKLLGWLGVE